MCQREKKPNIAVQPLKHFQGGAKKVVHHHKLTFLHLYIVCVKFKISAQLFLNFSIQCWLLPMFNENYFSILLYFTELSKCF